MDIQLENNQVGLIGDFVPSTVAGTGKKHFVTPKHSTYGMPLYEQLWKAEMFLHDLIGWGPLPPKPTFVYATDVTLKASVTTNFDATFKWENATPVAGSPGTAKVS